MTGSSAPLPLNMPRRAQEAIEQRLQTIRADHNALEISDILVRLGYLQQGDVGRIEYARKRRGAAFGPMAVRLKLATREQVQIAHAMQHGYVRETASRFHMPKGLAVVHSPGSPAAEQIKLLRTRLLTAQSKERLNIFAITPTAYNAHGEFLAANLAASFALLRRRVLLIDADLKKPRMERFFGLSGEPGLTDILAGRIDLDGAMNDSVVTNLSLLTAGPRKYNMQELIASDGLAALFAQAQTGFDHVIIMTTPGAYEADARFAWRAAGAALVAARRDVTRQRELKNLGATLRQLDVDILGAAMTR